MEAAYKLATSTLHGRLITPYQHEGVAWLLNRELDQRCLKGGFLCDEMGLGKTVQLIATMLGNPKPHTLIVVPKSVVSQWENEIQKFSPTTRTLIYHPSGDTDFSNYDVVLTTYGLTYVRGNQNKDTCLHRFKWDRIILDEAHEIRNKNAKVSKSIKTIKSHIRWIVTGTPVFNSINDFVSLGEFVGIPKSVTQGRTKDVREKYVLRRTKDDLAKFNKRLELPPCEFENVELEMSPEEETVYEEAFDEGREFIKEVIASSENAHMHTMEFLEKLLRVRQCMCYPQLYIKGVHGDEKDPWVGDTVKMKALFDNVKTHPTEKCIIFCQFIGEMDYIQENLDIPSFRIDGSISHNGRESQIAAFKSTVGAAAFVIQIKAGGVGLNLQEATRVYIMSPSWNPATELQAIGRSHRTGQDKKVFVKKFVYKGKEGRYNSVEESMMALQGSKSKVSSEVLNDPRLASKIPVSCRDNITIREIRKIFSV
jgi:SNF2 family DNA or RNA helicase